MEESFPHLPLQREMPVNEKRAGGRPIPVVPNDVPGHGRGLLQKLANAKKQSADDVGGFDDRRLFRFSVEKGFIPENLRKISTEIEFVSQEDETVVIGFASNAALDQFEARLATMAKGSSITNKDVIYALQGIDGLSPEDRKGWALKKLGFPESEKFLLDIELWPLKTTVWVVGKNEPSSKNG